ncbi:MAG: NupC/NupG family nucleoside CNT transporter [Flavobacteriales bacterium]
MRSILFASFLFLIPLHALFGQDGELKAGRDTAAIEGNWLFERIVYSDRGDRSMQGLSLELTDSSRFFYRKGKKLLVKGSWREQEGALLLRPDKDSGIGKDSVTAIFAPAGPTRLSIEKLSIDQLILKGPVASFHFDSQLPAATEGFTLFSFFRGILGIGTVLLLGMAFSSDVRAIDWSLVIKGLLLQFVLAILILKVPWVESAFEALSSFFLRVINFADAGAEFLFRSKATGEIMPALQNFVVDILPTIIFFSALTSLFYYLGILQRIVYGMAWIMRRLMNLSGAESLAAAGNVFIGQTSAPLLIKPYLPTMTRSEIMCLMSGGMATIAGGVLAAYVGFLGGDDPAQQAFFAKHLLTASVMSAPAAIVAAKMLVPEKERFEKEMKLENKGFGTNALEAVTNGTGDGLRLAVNVAAMLLTFIALITMGNYILKDLIGEINHPSDLNSLISANTNYKGFTFQFIIGYLFAPNAGLIGIAREDMVIVGQLLGEKTIVNEFIAYKTLGEMKAAGAFSQQKSVLMATYILCGFANFASIGIQIGGIGALIPNRKALLSQLGIKALIAGTLACLFTAVIVGMLGVS